MKKFIICSSGNEFGKYGEVWLNDLVNKSFSKRGMGFWLTSSVFFIEGDLDTKEFNKFIHSRRSKRWYKKLGVIFDVVDPKLISFLTYNI